MELPLFHWKKWPAALFRTSASLPPAKSVARCASVAITSAAEHFVARLAHGLSPAALCEILAPREWTVGGRMQFTFRETREAKRLEQLAALTADLFCDQL